MKDRKTDVFNIDLLLLFCTGLSLTMLAISPINKKPSVFLIYTVCAVLSIIWSVLFKNPKRTVISLCSIVILLIAFLFAVTLAGRINTVVNFAAGYIKWIVLAFRLLEPKNDFYCYLTVWLLTGVITLINAIIIKAFKTYMPSILIFIAAAIIISTTQFPVPIYLIYYILFVFTLSTAKSFYQKKKQTSINFIKKGRFALIVLFLAGFSILITASAAKTEVPLNQNDVRKTYEIIYYTVKEFATNKSEFPRHALNRSGYGIREAPLGGKTDFADRELMTVTTKYVKPVYLTSTMYGKYSTNRWHTVSEPKTRIGSSQTVRPEETGALYSGVNRMYTSRDVMVEYKQMNTMSIFSNIGYTDIVQIADSRSDIFVSPLGTMSTEFYSSTGFKYSMRYNDLDINGLTRAILTMSTRFIYENDYKKVAQMREMAGAPSLTAGERAALAAYSEWVSDNYLQIPQSIQASIKKFADDITSSNESDYIKARQIEAYLRNNYTYNIDCEEIKENTDFVTEFLFKRTEGYCQHFATATVILLRAAGIPARYVEGYMFLKPELMTKNAEGMDVLSIRPEYGHAWAEAYFEGAGWVRIESTPGITESDEQLPEVTEPPTTDAQTTMTEVSEVTEPPTEPEDEWDEELPEDEESMFSAGSTVSAVLITVFIIAAFIALSVIRARRAASKFKNLRGVKKALYAYEYYCRVLMRVENRKRRAEQTPYEFADEVDKDIIIFGTTFRDMTSFFCAARYGNEALPENSDELIEAFDERFTETVGRRHGRLYIFAMTYILPVLKA